MDVPTLSNASVEQAPCPTCNPNGWLSKTHDKQTGHLVRVTGGSLYIPVKNRSHNLNEHQIAAYFLRPRDNISLLKAVDDTIFVSDLVELMGYEFRCIPIRDDQNPHKVKYTYNLMRV